MILISACLNQFLDSKGFKFSKVGEVHDAFVGRDNRDSSEKANNKDATDSVRHVCDKCDIDTSTKEELETHRIQAHLKIMFKCSSCNFETEVKNVLKKHIDDVHEEIEVVLENTSKNEESEKIRSVVFQCKDCEFQVGDKKILKEHYEKEHVIMLG